MDLLIVSEPVTDCVAIYVKLNARHKKTRPRAEDASRVVRRADPVAECDLAEVSPRDRFNPR